MNQGKHPDFGRLNYVDAREMWESEEKDFTPWLMANLDLLGAELGMELEAVEQEASVGGFRSDLVCHEAGEDRTVIIENQLEETDHDHLGKILTYAAGRGAKIVVWISTDFRDEHSQAIDWLNEISRKEVQFFGVELTVIKVDGSKPAPSFRLVAAPNAWQKTGAETALTTSEKLRHAFWEKFLSTTSPDIIGRRKQPSYDHWFTFSSGKSSFWYVTSFAKEDRLRVELAFDTNDKVLNKKIFDDFKTHEAQLSSQIAEPLSWERLEDKRQCRIAVYRPGHIKDQAHWDEYMQWFREELRKFRTAFTPLIMARTDA